MNTRLRSGRRASPGIATALMFAVLAVASNPAPLLGQTTPPSTDLAATGENLDEVESLVAIGRGESRATNSITFEDLELTIPGVLAERLLDKMPGINVLSTDPFGFYEFGNDIRVRAFSLSKLAVSLDGVPMGNNDARYGTPIGRMIDSENLNSIKVSQGAGDVTTPAYEALGGSLQYFTLDPQEKPGALMSMTYGDFAQKRMFARVDTGELVHGLTGYVSASHFEFEPRGLENIAKGKSRKLEAKFKYEMPKATLRFAFTYNDRDDYDTVSISWSDYQALEAGDYKGTGQGYIEYTPAQFANNYSPEGSTSTPFADGFAYGDYSDRGRHLGPPVYIDPSVGAGVGVNAQYYDQWRNGRMDYFSRMVGDFYLTPELTLKVTPYYQDKRNYGTFGVPKSTAETQVRAAYSADPDRDDIWAVMYYDEDGNALDVSGNIVTEYSSAHAVAAPTATPDNYVAGIPGRAARDEDFGGHRYGISSNFEWKKTNNTLIFGMWYEYDRHGAYRPTYNLASGSITGDFAYDQPLFLNYSRFFKTDVYQGWLQDTFKMMDGKLDIVAGIKALRLERDVHGFLDIPTWLSNVETVRAVTYEDTFLPQLGLLYRLNPNTELFFNYSENMATPTAATLSAPSGFVASLLSPEYSDNYDIGVRGSFGDVSYNLQAYYIKYVDRILSVPIPPSASIGLAGQNAFQNVGGVDSWGAEISADWKTPIEGLSLTGSLALQETTFQEDLINGVDVDTGEVTFFPIKGNDLGNTPFLTANFSARYTVGQFRFNLGGKYFDNVYINTLNTQELPSYTVFDGSIAYAPPAGSPLEGFSIALNVYNLFDEYFWTAASYTGNSGTIQADQGRQVSLTLTTRF